MKIRFAGKVRSGEDQTYSEIIREAATVPQVGDLFEIETGGSWYEVVMVLHRDSTPRAWDVEVYGFLVDVEREIVRRWTDPVEDHWGDAER